MPQRRYTPDEKNHALDLYAEHGPTAVQDTLGIPKGTVAGWARAAGIRTRSVENLEAGLTAARLTFEERRTSLAHGLLDDIARLRAELFAPCVERKPLVVSDGPLGSHVEVVDVERTQPTFAEQARIMTSIGIAVDKTQLLSGAATERHEHVQVDAVDAEISRLVDELAGNDPAEAAPVGPA